MFEDNSNISFCSNLSYFSHLLQRIMCSVFIFYKCCYFKPLPITVQHPAAHDHIKTRGTILHLSPWDINISTVTCYRLTPVQPSACSVNKSYRSNIFGSSCPCISIYTCCTKICLKFSKSMYAQVSNGACIVHGSGTQNVYNPLSVMCWCSYKIANKVESWAYHPV